MAFEVCFVVTNGIIRRRFLWVTYRKSGFYFAFASKGLAHQSYHKDGNTHFKTDDGMKIPGLTKRTPLDQIKGVEYYTSIGTIITDDVLDQFAAPEFDDTRYDNIIYIDNRKSGGLSASIYLVEPWKHGDIPMIADRNNQLYLYTNTVPWLAIVINEQP